jgi:hypothetical protein
MCSGMNHEGYSIAINKCFDAFGEFFEMPTKGALTQARDRISYTFFKDQFEEIKSNFNNHKKNIKDLAYIALMVIFMRFKEIKILKMLVFMVARFKVIKKVIF